MNCEEAKKEFSALLDGELTPGKRAQVEAHLGACADCLRELDGFKRVDGFYRGLPAEAAPEGFEEGVRKALRPGVVHLARARFERKRLWPLLAAAATFAVLVGGVLLQFRPAQERMKMASAPDAAEPLFAQEALPPAESRADMEMPAKGEEVVAGRAMKSQEAKGIAGGALQEGVSAISEAKEMQLDSAAGLDEPRGAAKRKRAENVDFQMKGSYILSEQKDSTASKKEAAPESPPAEEMPFDLDPSETEVAETHAPPPSLGYIAAPAAAPAADEEKPNVEMEEGALVDAPADKADSAPAMTARREAKPKRAAELAPMRPAPEPQAPLPPPAAKMTRGGAAGEMRAEAIPKTVRRVGDRVFELRDGVWYQEGYEGGEVEELARGSEGLSELLEAHPDMTAALDLGERIVFRAADAWYRVAPSPGE